MHHIHLLHRSAAAAQHIHPGHHLIHGKRFRQIIVRAGIQPFDPAFDIPPRCQDQYPGGALRLPHAAHHGKAIQRWQPQIKHHQVGCAGLDGMQGLQPIMNHRCRVPCADEGRCNVASQIRLIFDNNNVHNSIPAAPSSRRSD